MRRNDRGHEQAIECSRSRAVGGVSGAAGEGDPEESVSRPRSESEARVAGRAGGGPLAAGAPHPRREARVRHSRTQPSSPVGSRTARLPSRTRSPGGRTRARRRASPAPRRGRRSSRTTARLQRPRARAEQPALVDVAPPSPLTIPHLPSPSLDVRGVRMDGSSGFSTRSPCGPWREKPLRPSDAGGVSAPPPRS